MKINKKIIALGLILGTSSFVLTMDWSSDPKFLSKLGASWYNKQRSSTAERSTTADRPAYLSRRPVHGETTAPRTGEELTDRRGLLTERGLDWVQRCQGSKSPIQYTRMPGGAVY